MKEEYEKIFNLNNNLIIVRFDGSISKISSDSLVGPYAKSLSLLELKNRDPKRYEADVDIVKVEVHNDKSFTIFVENYLSLKSTADIYRSEGESLILVNSYEVKKKNIPKINNCKKFFI